MSVPSSSTEPKCVTRIREPFTVDERILTICKDVNQLILFPVVGIVSRNMVTEMWFSVTISEGSYVMSSS